MKHSSVCLLLHLLGAIKVWGLETDSTDHPLENAVRGDALVHLNHEELRDMGINSVGHRITILKNVYHVKVSHDVPIEQDHYVPVCKFSAVLLPCFRSLQTDLGFTSRIFTPRYSLFNLLGY